MDANHDQNKGTSEMVRSLFVLLILGGIGVGALVSMQIRERQRRAGLMADNHELQTELAFIEARHGEMVNFLARPQTQLVKLNGSADWAGQAMTIAWNPVQRMAVVLMDRMPAAPTGMVYRLRAGTMALGALNPAAPAQVVYSVPSELGNEFEFKVTIEKKDGERAGQVVFQVKA